MTLREWGSLIRFITFGIVLGIVFVFVFSEIANFSLYGDWITWHDWKYPNAAVCR